MSANEKCNNPGVRAPPSWHTLAAFYVGSEGFKYIVRVAVRAHRDPGGQDAYVSRRCVAPSVLRLD